MSPTDVLEIARAALILILTVAGPMLITSLIIGVGIGLFQALTQIQEATLTFVPKLIGMGLVMLACLPMIGSAMSHFMMTISDKIVSG